MTKDRTTRSSWATAAVRLGVVAGVGSLLLTACGSSGGSSGSSGSSAKADVKVMVLGSIQSQSLSVPGIQYGVQAAVGALNAAGGLNGHKVVVEVCNDQVDANQAAACARKAVTDKVIAVVGALTIYGDAVVPILKAANIPDVGPFPISDQESDNADSWPIQGGNLMEARGVAELMKQAGVTSVNQVEVNTVAGKTSAAGVKVALQARGITVKHTDYVPATTSDMAAAVKAATRDGVGGITTNLAPPQVVPLITAAHQQGISQKLGFASTILSPDTLKQAGAAADGVLTAGSFPPLDDTALPSIVQYNADMTKYEPGKSYDAFSLNGWGAVQLLKLAGTGVKGDLTSANLITALNGISNQKFLWIDSFSTTPNPTKGSSRIFNTTVFLGKVQDGKIVAQGDPVALSQ
jgi:ABC-type branched-subunit amino acid transport system substrate-binding protein